MIFRSGFSGIAILAAASALATNDLSQSRLAIIKRSKPIRTIRRSDRTNKKHLIKGVRP